jgi:hypothetical protein
MNSAKDVKKKSEKIITRDTLLSDVLKIPGSDEILHKYNLPCMGCPMMGFEMGMLKIGDTARAYGLNDKKLIEDLNRLVDSKKKVQKK